MIRFYKATRSSRRREKNKRFILQIGKLMFHLSAAEANRLVVKIDGALLNAGCHLYSGPR